MSSSPHGYSHPDTVPISTRRIDSEEVFHDDDRNHDEAQTAKLKRDHHNSGYLDGITSVKEEAMQQGFDDGYPAGAELGLQVGRIIGNLQATDPEKEKTVTEELAVDKIISDEYFDKNADPKYGKSAQDHPLIQKYV